MLNGDVKSLISRGDQLFGSRGSILSFWQDSAENFYPQRAHFTSSPNIGEDFAANLYTSYPILVHRELSGAISSMLRRRDTQWGKMSILRDDRLDSAGRQWLEYATKVQWRAMYDKNAMFVRATKEGDGDFAAFGQTCITREINWELPALLYRCWHLRDCAWAEDVTGQVNELHINWEPTVGQLCDRFGEKKLHKRVWDRRTTQAFATVKVRRVLVPSEYYQVAGKDGQSAHNMRKPYTVLYIDVENEHVIEEAGRRNKGFTLARWQTVSGSAIAYSPAVIAALPDTRLIQAMTLTMLEAGEAAVRPPLLGRQNVIRGDAQVYPGGITWANLEGDERLEEVLRPIYQEKSGLPIGLEMNQDTREQIAAAFYLNKLSLPNPETAGKMTAYEIAERLKEWIRSAIPLFEPMETEYNADLCEGTFDDLMGVGAFGPVDEIPESLQGQDVSFQFQSPLHENIERQKAHSFLEARDLILAAVGLDKAAIGAMDVREGLREALLAVGVEPKLVRDKQDVDEFADQLKASEEAAQMVEMAHGAGAAAEQVGKGQKALEGA